MPLAACSPLEVARDFARALGHRMHRNVLLQLINEGAAAETDLGRIGANHAMHEFGDSDRRDRDLDRDLDLVEGLLWQLGDPAGV